MCTLSLICLNYLFKNKNKNFIAGFSSGNIPLSNEKQLVQISQTTEKNIIGELFTQGPYTFDLYNYGIYSIDLTLNILNTNTEHIFDVYVSIENGNNYNVITPNLSNIPYHVGLGVSCTQCIYTFKLVGVGKESIYVYINPSTSGFLVNTNIKIEYFNK